MTIVRIRLPRDKSFIYLRFERRTIQIRFIRRRYYSLKRVEVMRFSTTSKGR